MKINEETTHTHSKRYSKQLTNRFCSTYSPCQWTIINQLFLSQVQVLKEYEFMNINLQHRTDKTYSKGCKATVKRAAKQVQPVLQHCCKTSWLAMLRALPPTFKFDWQQIRLRGFFTWVAKRHHRYSTRFAAKSQDRLHVFVLAILPYLERQHDWVCTTILTKECTQKTTAVLAPVAK